MGIENKVFGKLPDGRDALLYTLKNQHGMTMTTTNFGCRILTLLTKDRDGNLGDVILGHKTLEEYFGNDFHGTFVGRYANRIGRAKFTMDGHTYELTKNDGDNTLHGGPGGYFQVLWNVDSVCDNSIVFSHTSPDGDEGYPGTLKMTVTYTLTDKDELEISYSAVCDQKTPFNPTNHSFFNLSGNPQKDVLDTVLQISAQKTTAVSDDLIPTGEFIPVSGGPLDFLTGKELGADMFAEDHLIQLCGGFDHNFCVDGIGFRKFAEAYEPESGRVMEVYSDLPGVQLYTFNAVSGSIGKDGKEMKPHTAFCLETQYYPDSVNHANFPFEFLQPGVPFQSKTVYGFSVK